jgi:hypothetical protein
MAASVRDGGAAAAAERVGMDDHDGAASDGEMDMDMDVDVDVEADSEVQHGGAADRRNGDGDDEYALVSNHVSWCALVDVFPSRKSEPASHGSAFGRGSVFLVMLRNRA